MTMEFGYYPGCALHGSAIEYGKSVANVFKNLGVDLIDIPDWSCCGASSGHMLNRKLGTALNARNLGLATEHGIKDILAPCPLCSEGMLKALMKMAASPEKRADIEAIIERKVDPDLNILNIVQAIDQTRDLWSPKLRDDVRELKVACYYGCLLVRPPEIVNFDEPERPMSIDNLVNEMGFEAVDWSFKTECCGGGFTVSNAEDVSTLVGKIYNDAIFHKADAIACVCPMCLANLEMAAGDAGKKFNTVYRMPVVYITDLLGLAIGMEATELALDQHLSDVSSLM
jgi:heterodisulfide reductase subunit B